MAETATRPTSSGSYDAFLEDCKNSTDPPENAGAVVAADAPELTASSSSDDSQPQVKTLSWTEMGENYQPKGTALSWTEGIFSQCNADTACGTLQIALESPTPALQDNGSPGPQEASPVSTEETSGLIDKPWTKEVYHAATNTWSTVNTKVSGAYEALEFAMKDPNFINEMSAKAQELKNSVATSAQSLPTAFMSTPAVKSIHASVAATLEKLTTTTDAKTEEEITPSASIVTEPGPGPSEEVKPSWNLWKELENMIHKFNLPNSISKLNRESRTLLGDLKLQVPSYLSSAWTHIQPQDKVEEAKEDEISAFEVEAAPTREVAPTGEVAPTMEAAPTEEASPAPEMTKPDLRFPW